MTVTPPSGWCDASSVTQPSMLPLVAARAGVASPIASPMATMTAGKTSPCAKRFCTLIKFSLAVVYERERVISCTAPA